MPRMLALAVSLIALTLVAPAIAGAQDRSQGRSMVITRYGIVSAESPLAAQAGAQMLARGGSAVDAGVVHQHLAHDAGGETDEMRAAGPVDGLAGEAQVGLMDERGGLQGVVGTLAAHVGAG